MPNACCLLPIRTINVNGGSDQFNQLHQGIRYPLEAIAWLREMNSSTHQMRRRTY